MYSREELEYEIEILTEKLKELKMQLERLIQQEELFLHREIERDFLRRGI